MKIEISRYSLDKEFIDNGRLIVTNQVKGLNLNYSDSQIDISVSELYHPLIGLEKMRLILEEKYSSLINCMGCRMDTSYRPTGGRGTYLNKFSEQATTVVNIFEPTKEIVKLSTVDTHRNEYRRWLESLCNQRNINRDRQKILRVGILTKELVYYLLSSYGHLSNDYERKLQLQITWNMKEYKSKNGVIPKKQRASFDRQRLQSNISFVGRILRENRNEIYWNICGKCRLLASSIYSKQCKNCGHKWHYDIIGGIEIQSFTWSKERGFILECANVNGEISIGNYIEVGLLSGLEKNYNLEVKEIDFKTKKSKLFLTLNIPNYLVDVFNDLNTIPKQRSSILEKNN